MVLFWGPFVHEFSNFCRCYPAALSSTSTSSHRSPLLVVYLQVVDARVGTIAELEAPVIPP